MTRTGLGATFEAVLFDWDGTAVPDRQADATPVRQRVEALCAAGVDVFVVSGTHVRNVDGQLAARPPGPGHLHLGCNRGSEIFQVGPDGPVLLARRSATDEEDAALDRAAEAIIQALHERGLESKVVSQRLNRRKIDLIPDPAWADPPKARIAELLTAVLARLAAVGVRGLDEVIELAVAASRSAGLDDPRITSDVKHVEVGLTDKGDAADWAAAWLADRGITGGLVLLAGDELGPLGGAPGSDSLMLVPGLARATVVSVGTEPGGVPTGVRHLGGGPPAFLAVLDEQLERRRARRVPWIDEDPAWVVPLPDEPALQRAAEAIGTLGNGQVGLRGAREEDGPGTQPSLLVNGVYTPTGPAHLLAGPIWTGVAVREAGPDRRLLDLRTGVLARAATPPGTFRSVRFVSAAQPAVMALRAEADPATISPSGPFDAATQPAHLEQDTRGAIELARVVDPSGAASIAVAVHDARARGAGHQVVDRLATWVGDASGPVDWDTIAASMAPMAGTRFDGLLAEHRQAWAQRWQDATLSIDGDPELELAARFALFHLLASAAGGGEAAVGARGLSGPAYGGHVFWDADVFVLPVLAAVHPAAARAMLEYRIRRLPAARAEAARRRRAGARFPWESAGSGDDVTPRSVRSLDGQLIPIHTWQREEHIVADVAWAACTYAAWTGDDGFLAGPGRDLVVEGARYWASRIRTDGDGRGHLLGTMGPDEYHEIVDDNAFTNVMARWHLRQAAALVEASRGDRAEAATWRDAADSLVDGWDASRGVYEQFAGYWELEPLLVASIAPPPVAADVVLGADRVRGSQVIKQADVLMLHHLVPDAVQPGSLRANLDFYEPRTAHGSSLSPAIHASLWARAGQPDRALEHLRVAARLDLDDVTGTTAGGVHLATMGGVWQALALGFLGLRATGSALAVDPCLPSTWKALTLRCRYRGQAIEVRADPETLTVRCRDSIRLQLGGADPVLCDPPGAVHPYGRRP